MSGGNENGPPRVNAEGRAFFNQHSPSLSITSPPDAPSFAAVNCLAGRANT